MACCCSAISLPGRPIFTAGWCEQAWAQALPPRIVQCSGGGFFTRVAAAAPPATEGKAATLGQLSVCCTTSVVVDGYGDLRAPCVDLGSGMPRRSATAPARLQHDALLAQHQAQMCDVLRLRTQACKGLDWKFR